MLSGRGACQPVTGGRGELRQVTTFEPQLPSATEVWHLPLNAAIGIKSYTRSVWLIHSGV